MVSLVFLSRNCLWPLIVTSLALVIVKAVFVAIFPDATPPDEKEAELFDKFLRPFGNSLFYDIYDTVFGWLLFVILSYILSIPWSNYGFRYSRFIVIHLMLATLAYTAIMMAPYNDTYFRETASDDWFVLVKKPSLLVGWISLVAVEFFGKGPSHWASHFAALILSLKCSRGGNEWCTADKTVCFLIVVPLHCPVLPNDLCGQREKSSSINY